MVLLVLIPVGLSIYLANTLYHRKGVPEALDALSKQLFQSKQEENKAEKRAEALERKTAELQSAYDALVADLRGEVDSKEVRVRRFGEKLEINFVDKVLFDSGSAVVTPHVEGRQGIEEAGGQPAETAVAERRIAFDFPDLPQIEAPRLQDGAAFLIEPHGVQCVVDEI